MDVANYRYLEMNLAMRKMFGIADLGQSIRDNFSDEVESCYDDYDRVVIDMLVCRVGDGAGRCLMVVTRDVTAAYDADIALRQSEDGRADC